MKNVTSSPPFMRTYSRRIGARRVKMMKGEWSDWEERHRRLSDEVGTSERGSERVSIKKGMFDVRGL